MFSPAWLKSWIIFLLVSLLGLSSCSTIGEFLAQATPTVSATPYPTSTPYPSHTPYPSRIPLDSHTPYPTHTPFPSQTPSPTPILTPIQIFAQDFDLGTGCFPSGRLKTQNGLSAGQASYKDGAYVWQGTPPKNKALFLWCDGAWLDDFTVQLDAIDLKPLWGEMYYGLAFRGEDENHTYAFLISPWIGEKYCLEYIQIEGSKEWSEPLAGCWKRGGDMRYNKEKVSVGEGVAPNRLKVNASGDVLELFINDQLVHVVRSDHSQGGIVGLVVGAAKYTGEVEIAFDNLIASQSLGATIATPAWAVEAVPQPAQNDSGKPVMTSFVISAVSSTRYVELLVEFSQGGQVVKETKTSGGIFQGLIPSGVYDIRITYPVYPPLVFEENGVEIAPGKTQRLDYILPGLGNARINITNKDGSASMMNRRLRWYVEGVLVHEYLCDDLIYHECYTGWLREDLSYDLQVVVGEDEEWLAHPILTTGIPGNRQEFWARNITINQNTTRKLNFSLPYTEARVKITATSPVTRGFLGILHISTSDGTEMLEEVTFHDDFEIEFSVKPGIEIMLVYEDHTTYPLVSTYFQKVYLRTGKNEIHLLYPGFTPTPTTQLLTTLTPGITSTP